jgi:hypothetical protein
MRTIAGISGLLLLGLCIIALGSWSILLILFTVPDANFLRYGLAAVFFTALLTVLIALCRRPWRWYAVGLYFSLVGIMLLWFFHIEPSNGRDWQTDVTTLASATIDGTVVTVHNIRNFDYHSEFDYIPHYYDKRFDLRELTGVDVVSVYWMGPAIAHVFLSFEFNKVDHLAISIETRKEKTEAYSTLKGFFRRYELYYVVADERDVIRLRTNFRHDPIEDVYIYRTRGNIDDGRRLFLEYIRQINALNANPEFYNTLTTNCTTSIWLNTRVNADHLPLDWKILVSGYVPQFLYENNRLETSGFNFLDLQRSVHVNKRALVVGDADDFSQRIRIKADTND